MEAPSKLPSNRRFGITFCVAFLTLGAYASVKGHGAAVYLPLFAAGLGFGCIGLAAPYLLSPLNRLWFRLGDLLGRIVSPLILGLIYFGVLTPIGLITRLFGRDALRLRRRRVSSYWVSRNPPGPTSQSFTNQF